MAFVLKVLSNTGTAVDFMDQTSTPARWGLMDGGFNISMTRKSRELKPSRPGFFKLVQSYDEYRIATINANCMAIQSGAYTSDQLRGYLLQELGKIEKFAMDVEDLQDPLDVSRGELIWKWSGATYTTYFEVYAVDIKLPDGVMSVETAISQYNDRMVMQDIEISLYIAPSGWGNSIHTSPSIELALENPSVGTPTTGGVVVRNPGYTNNAPSAATPHYPYVETDTFNGNGRPLMKLVLTPDTTYYTDWRQLFIGHVIKSSISPYWPSKEYFIGSDATEISEGDTSITVNLEAGGGPYDTMTGFWIEADLSGPGYNPDPKISWPLGGYSAGQDPFPGNYYALACGGLDLYDNDDIMMAIGVVDKEYTYAPYANSNIVEQGLYYTVPEAGSMIVPLGMVQFPPARMMLTTQGSLHQSIRVGVWFASNSVTTKTWSFEYIRLLPITNGMRVWTAMTTGTGLASPFYDDMMLNLYYAKNGSSKVFLPFQPYLDSLRLHPTQTNRLYFTSYGVPGVNIQTDRQRGFKVQVYITESFSTLAY